MKCGECGAYFLNYRRDFEPDPENPDFDCLVLSCPECGETIEIRPTRPE